MLRTALGHGLAVGAVFNGGTLWLMRRYPGALASALPRRFEAQPPAEARRDSVGFLGGLAVLLPTTALLTVRLARRAHAGRTLRASELFWHGYLVTLCVNVGDALLLDLVEIPRRRHVYAPAAGVVPERLTARFIARHLTAWDHGLLWPTLVCPAMGLLVLATVPHEHGKDSGRRP